MEKRYKIEKLKKYGEEWKESKDWIEKMTLIGALSLVAAVAGIGNYTELSHIPDIYTKYNLETSSLFLTGIGVPVGLVSIAWLIASIRDKIILENKIDEMNEELDLLEEQEQSKTRGRR